MHTSSTCGERAPHPASSGMQPARVQRWRRAAEGGIGITATTLVMAFVVAPLPRRPLRARVTCATQPPAPRNPPRPSLLTSRIPILPLLVRVARTSWYTFWRVLMGEIAPSDAEGRYIRPVSNISNPPPGQLDMVSSQVLREFNQSDARHTMYIGLACQWCHRVMLARALLRLESQVEVRYLDPGLDGLWVLRQAEDGATLLKERYVQLDRKYQGRFTAPLLVDSASERILSNESADILAIFAKSGRVEIDEDTEVWLRPDSKNNAGVDVDELDEICDVLYEGLNDGVYRCGFATSQMAYEEAESKLFETLDRVEGMLTASRFVCSATTITEADVRLFPTVFRFDGVYGVLFKACRKSIRADYPAISAWMRDIFNLAGVAETCDLDATRKSYFTSLFPLNPGGIVPAAAQLDVSPAPQRRGLGLRDGSAV